MSKNTSKSVKRNGERLKGISPSKAHRHSERRKIINKMRISRIRTFIKNTIDLIAQGDKDAALSFFVKTQSEIMKGVSKKVLKLNTASRRVSALNKKIKAMN